MSMNVDRQLLEAVFDTISDEVQALEVVANEEGRITDFKYLLGNKEKDLIDKDWLAQTGLFNPFIKVAETGEPLDTIVSHHLDGITRWYHIRAKKLNHGLVVFREDVTMAKQAEEKIMHLNTALFNKNRELEALSSELKTLNSIAANEYNETLKHLYNSMEFLVTNDARNLTDAGRANIRRAQASIQKMKLMTDDIIAFSKVHSQEEMTDVDMNEVVVIVLNSLKEKILAENAVINAKNLPVIRGYQALLNLLFYHLLNNALKFRKEEIHPEISIKNKLVQGKEIEHSAALRDIQYHQISVIDNGIGFPPEEGEKIFTMFYRLHEKGKHKGSGVGLAICKKIMDLHGGFISSECTPECTTFHCYFPV